ncbi:MAG: aryl-sulfate sulfotransferase [Phycisphaerae bacterium]|nr:aryl-sulfate sulfotransferase [Phycisphaerae bacterium]
MNQPCAKIAWMSVLIVCGVGQAVTVTDYAATLGMGYQYLDPRPESEYVAGETRLLIRFEATCPADLVNLSSFIQVVGEKSGLHIGKTTIATDGRTVVFEPSAPFQANEAVDVVLSPLENQSQVNLIAPIQYRFYVLRPAAAPLPPNGTTDLKVLAAESPTAPEVLPAAEPVLGRPTIMGNGVSVPSDFPHVSITKNRHPADGYIFTEYRGEVLYALILDNSGAPAWYRRGTGAEDFKVQKNGMITETQYRGYDQNFNRVKDFHAANGYEADSHDLQVLADGGYLILGLRTLHNVDMSRVVDGGYPNATIQETCLQEFTAADELIFQWRAWENFDVAALGPVQVEDVRGPSVRVSHMNAIDVDEDGHLLVSSRHLSEVTKINRQTGAVIWRLGGPHSDFSFVNDPLNGFSCQHDIRVVGQRRYTVFDNGNDHHPPVSRAVEYQLDPNARTATLVWEYRAVPDRYAYHQGNAQRLPNGNTLINFVLAEYPKVTEVSRDGEIEFEMDFINHDALAYRVFRFPWTGLVEKPYLVVESHFDRVTLLFNKFGDPTTAHYRIYGGLDPQPQTVTAISDKTLLDLQDLENDRRYYFRVTAVDLDGNESPFSNEESTVVYFYDPNQPSDNLVQNGDFSQDRTDWTLLCGDSADAQWAVEEGRAHVKISDGGQDNYNLRLIQSGLKLVRGETYVLAFDAGATAARLIEVKVNEKNVGSYWDYSKMGPVYLTAARRGLVMQHFTHRFVMDAQTDLDGCLEINMGLDDADVYLDNLSLVRQAR